MWGRTARASSRTSKHGPKPPQSHAARPRLRCSERNWQSIGVRAGVHAFDKWYPWRPKAQQHSSPHSLSMDWQGAPWLTPLAYNMRPVLADLRWECLEFSAAALAQPKPTALPNPSLACARSSFGLGGFRWEGGRVEPRCCASRHVNGQGTPENGIVAQLLQD